MKNAKLGTFLGVYTPTILTIFGVIMYMRSGWVVGNMGLILSVLIILIANLITFITTLSFSAIATNKKTGAGGAYFIISRSMGEEIGSAIGIPLFLSQTFSVTLYAFGLAEAMKFIWSGIPVGFVAFIIILLVAFLSWKGADFALKTQIPLMILVGISIVFLVIGAFLKSNPISFSIPKSNVSFFAAFAVFFPAVTGVMAGLGLSGDLKNPQQSIPKGAILASLTGFILYISLPFLLIMGSDFETLKTNSMVWTKIAPLGAIVIIPGLLGAILSSAIGSMLGAPRTLLALAQDEISSKKLKSIINSPKGNKISFIVSTSIALLAVFLGNLNAVAVVVTMFFLTVYGMVNFAAAMETFGKEPFWRPKIKIPWIISFIGGTACVAVMFLINPIASIIAIIIEAVLFFIFKKRSKKKKWGDARRGFYESLIRKSLIKLRDYPQTPRNWRPNLLLIVNSYKKQEEMIKFADLISQHSGIVTINKLILGDFDENVKNLEIEKEMMKNFFDKLEITVFPEINFALNFHSGIRLIAQANGIAGIESNTLMICWPDETKFLPDYLKIMRDLEKLKRSFIIAKTSKNSASPQNKQKTIHIWWGGLQRNGDMMLLVAHLISTNPAWKNSEIKVLSISSTKLTQINTEQALEKMMPEIRINAKSEVILKPEDKSIVDIIHEKSKNADLVFFGLNTPQKGKEEEYSTQIIKLAGDLKTVFFIKNASDFSGRLLND